MNLLGLPSLSQIDEPLIVGRFDRDEHDIQRQSRSFRQPINQKEEDKMLYYHLNDRLVEPSRQRKLTPHREHFRTIEDPSTDMNTSRFGKKDRENY